MSENPYPREGAAPAPLLGIRVLDLATPLGEMAGRILADLGAEVIKIEPPEGCEARHMGPFDESGGPRNGESLYWAALGRGKKSVTLDLTCGPDREVLLGLVRSADVLIESWKPGFATSLGIGPEAFAEVNTHLVYTSVSPYGQDGPWAAIPASEVTIEAASGLLSLQGDEDRPNIPVGYPQTAFHAGAQAATDTVIALYERSKSGLGQHLDVSAQAAMVWTLMNATEYPPMIGANPTGTCENRGGPPAQLFPGLSFPKVWECKDGYALCNFVVVVVGPRTFHATMRWAESEGHVPTHIQGLTWSDWVADFMSGKLAGEHIVEAVEVLKAFLKTKTKVEIQAFSAEAGILLGAVYDIHDLPTDPQLVARDYFREVEGYTHPGPFARFHGLALADLPRAPRIGEHQHLLEEESAAVQLHGSGSSKLSFEGLKVADFAWVGVGPIISKALADHGATVVHVESSTRPDPLRLLPPFKDGVPGIDRAQFMANFNSSKLGLACNMSQPKGRELARKLVEWSDVVVESFVPGNMKKWGLDYESIRQFRPDIVMLSTCLRGQTGPEAAYTGFGGQGAALAGIHAVTGWPDRPPAGPWGAYTDFINPRYGVAALTAALLHHDATGQGAYVDLAQSEAGIRFVEPLVLDYTVNGRKAPPSGHDSLYACPHVVLQCEGIERYVALACETATHWRSLRSIAPLDAFADSAYNELATRIANKAAIEDVLREWARSQEPFALVEMLRNAGVPASVVERPMDLYDDPQLAHRGFFVTLDHAEMGPTPYDGLATQFSRTPGRLAMAAPTLGQHTDHVLREVLRLSDEEILDYAMNEVLV